MGIFELVYYIGLSAKKYYLLKKQRKLPGKVISIGNISVGGTGKTPAAIAVAIEAQKRGLRPIILTRGYKGRVKGPCFVSRGDGPVMSADEAGDEPVIMSEKLRGVPIVKGGNRYQSGIFAIKELGAVNNEYLFILDDGFQHWGLYRDKDIVLVDSLNPFDGEMLLPLGRLREPVSSLSRADMIVLTRCEKNNAGQAGKNRIVDNIKRHNQGSPVFFAEHDTTSCRLISGDSRPLSWMADKEVFAFCAVGNPESFKRTIESTGAELKGFKKYRDHYRYNNADILNISREAENCGARWIATTEKDIIKAGTLDLPENILIIEIAFKAGTDFYDEIFSS